MIRKTVGKAMQELNDIVMGAANSRLAKGTSKAIFGGLIHKGIDSSAGLINKSIEAGKRVAPKIKNAAGKINKENMNQLGKSVISNTLKDDNSYKPLKAMGKEYRDIEISKKFLAADAIGSQVRGTTAAIINMSRPFVKQVDEGSALGIKATGLGIAAVAVGNFAVGTPKAISNWEKGRRGYSTDMQAQKIAPQTPAYANNGGATGDLVFALNNLRHGGMM